MKTREDLEKMIEEAAKLAEEIEEIPIGAVLSGLLVCMAVNSEDILALSTIDICERLHKEITSKLN